jgi:predicted amidohydrolase
MRIGLIQLTSVLDYRENLKKIRSFFSKANAEGVEALFLPECFYSMSDGTRPSPFLIEEKNEHYQNIKSLALESKIYLLGGSAATENPKGEKVLNRCYNFSPNGEDLGHYDKNHLFSCDLSQHQSKKVINEADIYAEGEGLKLIEIKKMRLGLSICFDLRFPEVAREYSGPNFRANTLSYSSAFTIPTGKAHWHTLLRARAIENQCFVVAAAQWGTHNERIQTFGHSLIIDPWGEVLADAGEGEKLIFADFDFTRQEEIRSRLDVLLK